MEVPGIQVGPAQGGGAIPKTEPKPHKAKISKGYKGRVDLSQEANHDWEAEVIDQGPLLEADGGDS